MKRRVLFTFSVLHARAEMARLMPEFRDRGWDVHLLIGFRGPAADALAAAAQAEGTTVHRVPDPWAYGAAPANPAQDAGAAAGTVRRPGRRPRVPAPLRPFVNALLYACGGFRQRAHARRLLGDIRPDVVVANNFHSCCEFDNAMNVEARRQGVPRACVLTSPLVAGIIGRRARLSNYHLGMVDGSHRADAHLLSRILARLRPDWTVGEGAERILCWPGEKIAGGFIAGLARRDVWENPSGDFDRIYAPSDKSRQLLVASGTEAGLIRVFGPPRLDPVIAEAADSSLRAEMAARFGLRPDEPYILYNVEPSWEHHYCDRETHFARIERIAAFLVRQPLRTLVSLHPLCAAEDYAPLLERAPQITISRGMGIERLYPGCRLVLSFGCSTNAYAVLWNKPLVMYDWFGIRADPWRWSLYDQPRLTAVTSFEDLERCVAAELLRPVDSGIPETLPVSPAAPRIVDDIIALASRPPLSQTA
ncbi:hypothetical protein [Rhabdaerophilum calidifontis]|uniref:hypothetical protein n=1 Tax=Rhabdaerophilum calidifontis TaxID=2604328 RepID=UPI001239DB3E|nr:hypothetical protein [Rhabdaerophilum calidifontis]